MLLYNRNELKKRFTCVNIGESFEVTSSTQNAVQSELLSSSQEILVDVDTMCRHVREEESKV